jgi:threonine aldolase
LRRRNFLSAPVAAAFAPPQLAAAPSPSRVYATGDGIPYTPVEYAQVLTKIANDIEADDFSRGGVVEKLESRMSALLGKEMAIWLPTGTLANQLAVRMLAGNNRRVLVPAESHLYNDCGDCCQTLSGLNLIPLGRGQSTFTLDEVEKAHSATQLGRVSAPIGAIEIESPVRRRQGERFDFAEMARISSWAKQRRIGIHLDGARLLIEVAYTKRPILEYTALFDTVYVSLYKYLNAASGAILAGPKSLLADLYQTRRMFGGGLSQVWPFAAVALHTLADFEQSFGRAQETSEAVLKALESDSNFSIERIANGTNIFRLRVHSVNAPVYHLRLEEAGISAAAPERDWFAIRVNATWARIPADEIVSRFRKALG